VKKTLLLFAAAVILATVTAPSLLADGNPFIPNKPGVISTQQ
jgi:hypothetical protein